VRITQRSRQLRQGFGQNLGSQVYVNESL